MKQLSFTFLFSLLALVSHAQTYTGTVKDAKTRKPLMAVSVTLEDEGHKPMRFTQTRNGGTFSISVPEGKQAAYLSFSSLGYARQTIAVGELKAGGTVVLHESATEIREVKVRSQRIRRGGDTLTYSVSGFRQPQDRSIADVIAKMPGMSVTNDGTIMYQGKPINKFYVEGMDLMGRKYAAASENIAADMVKDVQVMRNHQPVKSLRNKQYTDYAALNLVLKDDAKTKWKGTIEAGAGAQLQKGVGNDVLHDGRLSAMMFAKGHQTLSLLKTCNTGRDIQHELRDQILDRKVIVSARSWISQISTGAPSVDRTRYTINNTHIGTTNWLFKTAPDDYLRLQASVLSDRSRGRVERLTQYADLADGLVVEEAVDARVSRHEVEAEAQYQQNRDAYFLNNTLRAYADFGTGRASTLLNDAETRQLAKPRKRYVADNFEVLRVMKNDRVLSLGATFCYNFLPGTLLTASSLTQHLDLTTINAQVEATFRHRIGKMNVRYHAQVSHKRSKVSLSRGEQHTDDSMDETEASLTPQVSMKRQALTLSASLPMRIVDIGYGGSHSLHPVAEPTLTCSYDLSGLCTVMAMYTPRWTVRSFQQVTPLPIYTSYNYCQAGTGDSDSYWSHTAMGKIDYSNPISGLFASAEGHLSLSPHMQLYRSRLADDGVYTREASGRYADSDLLSLNTRLGKAFGMGKLLVSLEGGYVQNRYHLLVGDDMARASLRQWQGSLSFSARPLRWLSVEEKSTVSSYTQKMRFDKEDVMNTATPSLTTFWHDLKAYLLYNHWQLGWINQLAHSNDPEVSTNYFSDVTLSYKQKRYELKGELHNIFGSTHYERRTISTEYSVYTLNSLRPREFLVKVIFNF